ncbi:MAG: hypothetical protein KDN20_15585 [Verrucomicrobiae bacterium]|nr:hypothetical protein [Verrucomicrobiae bacterium]
MHHVFFYTGKRSLANPISALLEAVGSGEYNPDGPIGPVDLNPKLLRPSGISDRPFSNLTNHVRPGDYPDQAARFEALKRRLGMLLSPAPVIMVEADELSLCLGVPPDRLTAHRNPELKPIRS